MAATRQQPPRHGSGGNGQRQVLLEGRGGEVAQPAHERIAGAKRCATEGPQVHSATVSEPLQPLMVAKRSKKRRRNQTTAVDSTPHVLHTIAISGKGKIDSFERLVLTMVSA
jgi:hypothetical protein